MDGAHSLIHQNPWCSLHWITYTSFHTVGVLYSMCHLQNESVLEHKRAVMLLRCFRTWFLSETNQKGGKKANCMQCFLLKIWQNKGDHFTERDAVTLQNASWNNIKHLVVKCSIHHHCGETASLIGCSGSVQREIRWACLFIYLGYQGNFISRFEHPDKCEKTNYTWQRHPQQEWLAVSGSASK